MKERGGAPINIGSVLAGRAIPRQGDHGASAHAVKGVADARRMELEREGAPIAVTQIKPGPIDTPYPHHVKNDLDAEPTHVPPVDAPETAARANLHAAETPTRDLFVGGGAVGTAALGQYAPRLADQGMAAMMVDGSKSNCPPHPREGNGLDRPSGRRAPRGGRRGTSWRRACAPRRRCAPRRSGSRSPAPGSSPPGSRRGPTGARRPRNDRRGAGQDGADRVLDLSAARPAVGAALLPRYPVEPLRSVERGTTYGPGVEGAVDRDRPDSEA